jgi:hypothetical protein
MVMSGDKVMIVKKEILAHFMMTSYCQSVSAGQIKSLVSNESARCDDDLFSLQIKTRRHTQVIANRKTKLEIIYV